MATTRYPLSWPTGWKRTDRYVRQRARFSARSAGDYARDLTVAQATDRLALELNRLGAANELLSTNLALTLHGWPRSDQREPDDPGAAVYFQLDGKPRVFACDKWHRVADNIAAIAAHIAAIRAVDRYGVGTLDQAFAGYTALPETAGSDWRAVLGLNGSATLESVETRYRELAREHHPDKGGDGAKMATINAARDAALSELGA